MPFTPRRLWAISPLGYGVSGVPNRYAFELLLPDGPAVSVRRDVALEPVSAREREKTRDRIQARMREVNPTWGWGGRDIPSVKPAYIELDVGLDGRIWLTIEQSVPPPVRPPPSAARGSGASGGGVLAPPTAPDDFVYEPTLFHVFEPDGRFVGAVAAPPRVTLMAMRGDYVWGVALGEYDIELVKRYRIVWPGG
jgi:hypothetical protein